MDDVVNVDAYFSRGLPPYLINLRRQVEDTLDEYRAYSGGRLHVEFKEPGNDPVTMEKLRSLGIPQVQLEILEKDQFKLTNVYLGIALLYGGRKEVIPVVQDISRLEYELTGAIVRLTSPEKKGVGWFAGSAGSATPRRGGSPLTQELGRFYDVRELGPEDLLEIPAQIRTLVIEGPQDLSEEARFALDQFLMGGGKAVFLVDHFSMPAGAISPIPMESGVHDLLEHYGVRLSRDVVVEPYYNATASFSSGFMTFRLPYPYWPRIPRDLLGREHPISSGLETVTFPWTSSLEVVAGEESGIAAEVLVSSSSQSWTESGRYNFSPQKKIIPPRSSEEMKSRPLAVLLSGRFPSFYEEREAPPPDEGEEPPTVVRESPETSILVVGSSRPANGEFLRLFPENAVFLMNAIDWMTFGSELIGIRSRTSGQRTLPDLPARAKTALKVGNVVLFPAAIALFGFLTLVLRRRRRNAH
jgi:gliding-associated putative ABC transporter substrate-binding component GldG